MTENEIFLLALGTSWVEVESPGKESEALHVSVGVSVVWVVTKDYKVIENKAPAGRKPPNICCYSHLVLCSGVVQTWRELLQPLWLRLDQHRRRDADGGRRTQRPGTKI